MEHEEAPTNGGAGEVSAPAPMTAEEAYAAGIEAGRRAAQVEAPAPQPIQVVVAQSETEKAGVERRAKQTEAGKAEHPQGFGELVHMQMLRDGTRVQGRKVIKDGAEMFLPVPVTFYQTPEGKIVDGGPYNGKYL